MINRLKSGAMAGLLVIGVTLSGCANMQQAATTATTPTGNVAETLKTVGTFDTFLKAAQAAGVMGRLTGEGPITVFAPTDEAFGKLPAGRLNQLLAPANRAQLRAVILNHIVEGSLKTDYFLNGIRFVTTDARRQLEVNGLNPDQAILFGRARISKPNIDASNGVIHAIDQVQVP